MNTKGIILAVITFILTFGIIRYFTSGSATTIDLEFKFHHPTKIEIPDGVAYTLDSYQGQEKELSFRCNPKTGEGYFSIKSKDIAWGSSHCQDMVGAVTEVEEGKKPFVILKLKKINNQIYYLVERNQPI